MVSIDLNCDMGESFGAWTMGRDDELMNYVSSVNIACGFHAGDATTIRQTIESAVKNNVAVGAHPSFPDLQGFGRREMNLPAQEIYDTVLYQIAAVKGICESNGVKLHHVKPHGALYNLAAKDKETARSIATAVYALDPHLIFYGLANSFLISEAHALNLTTASEAFSDRTYQSDGSLTPRNQPNALIKNTDQALSQVLQIIQNHSVTTIDSQAVALEAQTICIHGDGENAVEFAKEIHQKLLENNIEIAAIERRENVQ